MNDWYPNASRAPGNDAGAFTGGTKKIVHHTTEGSSYGGALGAFQSNNSWPHFTDTYEGGVYRVFQHIPLSRAARALEHPSGTGETNRDSCIQIEHVGFANQTADLPAGYLAGIAQLCRWIEHEFGVACQSTVPFTDSSHVKRLSWDAFHAYKGHLGHQHVPNQTQGHWDPGRLPVDRILTSAPPPVPWPSGAPAVISRDAKMRERPDGTADIVEEVPPGTGVQVLRVAGDTDWRAVCVTATEAVGYVKRSRLAGVPSPAPISPSTTLVSPARALQVQAEADILPRPNGTYDDADVREILGRYYDTGPHGGLDPLLAVAQMTLETASLSSEWSQPPHNNPAGIGVTGQPGVGISFPDWPTAVRAHVGRLLAYALPPGAANPDQQELIHEALSWRPLPDTLRGVAPTLGGLSGRWAADTQYADKISSVANRIRALAPAPALV